MSVAEKTRPTKVTVEVPRSILPELKKLFGSKVRELDDEEVINVRDSEWYKKVSADRTPGRALRVYRNNRGYSQSELAKKLGETVTKQHVSDWETGQRPISKEVAKKLAAVLKAPVERFI